MGFGEEERGKKKSLDEFSLEVTSLDLPVGKKHYSLERMTF